MLKKNLFKTGILAAIALSVSACGVSNAVTSDGLIVGEPKFESIQKDTFTSGKGQQRGLVVEKSFNEAMVSVKKGVHKDAIMYGKNSLGAPHYHEGFGSRLLTYTLSKSNGVDFDHCQIKIAFDKNERVNQVVDYPMGCSAEVSKEVPAPVVKHPQTRKINLKAGSWFDFDQAVLKAQYAPELREFAQAVSKMDTINRVVVVGHTDQSGTDAYNQVLSENRAKAVANYLVAHGVPANALHVVGLGESEPVKDCGNPDRPSEATKACNYDNRRVEIYVNGSVEQIEQFAE